MVQPDTKKAGIGLTELLDKDLPVSMLKAALRCGRLGGTLLFFGPDGSGKSSLAFWLAAALNCLAGPEEAPCGRCGPCRKIERLIHPDVFWVFPLPGNFYKGEHPDEVRLAQLFQDKRERPWLDTQFQEKSEHHLSAVSRVRAEAARSCYEGRRKVFVVTGADRLRVEAANAFLKLLEEPRPTVTLILCSDRPSSLLPTILSRCQRLQVRHPGRPALAALLENRFEVPGPEARELLALADGNLAAALRLHGDEDARTRNNWIEKTFQAVLEPGFEGGYGLLDERKGPLFNRGDFERYLACLIQALRDALLVCLGRETAHQNNNAAAVLISGPVREYAERVADSGPLIKLLGRLINLRDELNRNVNLRLLGWSILYDMREVIAHE